MAALDIYFHALEDAMDATGLLGLVHYQPLGFQVTVVPPHSGPCVVT